MSSQPNEIGLFLRRWLANPLRVGAIAPSSAALAKLVARNTIHSKDELVVELGAGTGTVTKALVDAGLPEENLILIELDRDMLAFLRTRFPRATVIDGDASKPEEVIPADAVGRVDTVISGIPALQFPLEKQRDFVKQCFSVLREDGQLLQYTYSLKSPLRLKALDVPGQRLGVAMANLPPAHLWGFKPRKQDKIADAAQ